MHRWQAAQLGADKLLGSFQQGDTVNPSAHHVTCTRACPQGRHAFARLSPALAGHLPTCIRWGWKPCNYAARIQRCWALSMCAHICCASCCTATLHPGQLSLADRRLQRMAASTREHKPAGATLSVNHTPTKAELTRRRGTWRPQPPACVTSGVTRAQARRVRPPLQSSPALV